MSTFIATLITIIPQVFIHTHIFAILKYIYYFKYYLQTKSIILQKLNKLIEGLLI